MAGVKFQDLTPALREDYCNGCGPKGLAVPVPRFLRDGPFGSACDHHDWNYTLGGREVDRLRADVQFGSHLFRCAIEDRDGYARTAFRVAWASAYLAAVTAFGWAAFRYADREPTEQEVLEGLIPRGRTAPRIAWLTGELAVLAVAVMLVWTTIL